jgi:hypothetical protein
VRAAGKGLFGAERVLSSRTAFAPEVAIDAQGRATAAWHVTGYGPIPQARRLTAAGTLAGPIETLPTANHWSSDYGGGPQVAPDPAGGAAVAWPDCVGTIGEHRCRLAIRRSNGGLLGPVRFVARPVDTDQLDLAIDTSGTATLMWGEQTRGHRVTTARVARDGTVSDVLALSPGTDQSDSYVFPKLATDGNGSTVAAWDSPRLSTGELVQSATFDGGGPLLTDVFVPKRVRRGRAVTLRATATEAFSNPAIVGWRFGDGAKASRASAAHTYRRCGAYEARFSARDAAGNTSTARRRVLVVARKCRIRSRVAARFDVDGARTKLERLIVFGVPRGARVQARGPFGRRAAKRRGRTVNVHRALKKRRTLRAGQRLEIRISKPGYIGKVVRYKIRAGKRPRALTRCVPPGRTAVRKRCG